jgi:hypothetical protein
MKRSAWEKALIGPAGEHFVMYQVHFRKRLAALAPRNLPHADVMIVSPDGATSALVQVKTRTRGADGGWHMREKHETISFPDLFYCFVDFEPREPVTYVVPSALVADVVREEHAAWKATPSKTGKPRGETELRRLRPRYPYAVPSAPDGWLDQWQERWDLLRC